MQSLRERKKESIDSRESKSDLPSAGQVCYHYTTEPEPHSTSESTRGLKILNGNIPLYLSFDERRTHANFERKRKSLGRAENRTRTSRVPVTCPTTTPLNPNPVVPW